MRRRIILSEIRRFCIGEESGGWRTFEDNPSLEFESFLEWCINKVGARKASMDGYFRHAGIVIDTKNEAVVSTYCNAQ